MLKVVGASWQKTRIGTYILIGAGLLVIGAFFAVYIDRPTYDGTYCATAYWTEQFGFQVEYWKQQNDLLNIPKGAARICYKDSIYENGWALIEVETQRTFPDWVQAYCAGLLEGSLTWNNIYNQWQNTIQASCERDENSQNFCNWLRELLLNNYDRINELASHHAEKDHYLHQISLFFYQLQGLEAGYMRGAKRARSDLEEEISFADFLLMNAAADIQDFKIYYENYVLTGSETNSTQTSVTSEDSNQNNIPLPNKTFILPSAIMLTKIFQTSNSSSWKLLFGHSTAGSYASMLRIQKRYKFHYHFSTNQHTNTVPGVDITFTGYPGILASTDDFYIVKGRQLQTIVAGVGIRNENLALWQNLNLEESIPLAARVMAANRISQNRRTWAKAMAKHPLTGCKQWITIDLNKLNPQGNLYTTLSEDEKHDDAGIALNAADEAAINERQNRNKGLVLIAEQLPGRMSYKDVTEHFILNGNSTWLAKGLPFLPEVLEASLLSRDHFDADKLTAEENNELTSLESVEKYLRTRGFRGDLLGDQSMAFGNIDIKLLSYNTKVGMTDYHAFAGPIFMRLQRMPPKPVPASAENQVSQESLKRNAHGAVVDTQNEVVTSALKDDRLNVAIEETDELAELELISERRSVRNDMKAIAALRRSKNAPFKWFEASPGIGDVEHRGQPDVWNFERVSPVWSW